MTRFDSSSAPAGYVLPPVSGGGSGRLMLKWFIGLCLFYMLAFPKGGLKIQDIPITIGYLLTVPLGIIAVLMNYRQNFPREKLIIIFLCFATAIWSLICYRANGGGTVGYTLAYFVALVILPVFCLLFISDRVIGRDISYFEKVLVNVVRFVAAFGIFLFFFKYVTGSWIEIPYLTVNADDLGGLDDKHINRGGVFKLISTYNNGNIFGVSMAILAPLYLFLERKVLFKVLFFLALLLTLSRTVWIGLLLIVIFLSLSSKFSTKRLFLHIILFIVGFFAVVYTVIYFGFDTNFLFDRNLGGRIGQFAYLKSAFFIPNRQGIDIPEIVYIGILFNYGYFGLILFILTLASPIIGIASRGVKIFSRRKAAMCAQGLVVYMILAASDGAFSYIPVMMIFWIVASLGLWYSAPSKYVAVSHA